MKTTAYSRRTPIGLQGGLTKTVCRGIWKVGLLHAIVLKTPGQGLAYLRGPWPNGRHQGAHSGWVLDSLRRPSAGLCPRLVRGKAGCRTRARSSPLTATKPFAAAPLANGFQIPADISFMPPNSPLATIRGHHALPGSPPSTPIARVQSVKCPWGPGRAPLMLVNPNWSAPIAWKNSSTAYVRRCCCFSGSSTRTSFLESLGPCSGGEDRCRIPLPSHVRVCLGQCTPFSATGPTSQTPDRPFGLEPR